MRAKWALAQINIILSCAPLPNWVLYILLFNESKYFSLSCCCCYCYWFYRHRRRCWPSSLSWNRQINSPNHTWTHTHTQHSPTSRPINFAFCFQRIKCATEQIPIWCIHKYTLKLFHTEKLAHWDARISPIGLWSVADSIVVHSPINASIWSLRFLRLMIMQHDIDIF